MHSLARTVAGAAVVAVTALGTVGVVGAPAVADDSDSAPCAQQEQKVANAEEALARLQAVFAHQKTKVERLQEKLAAATTPEEQAKLQAKLDKTMAKKVHTKKDKKAQVQRLAKAQARLDACMAG